MFEQVQESAEYILKVFGPGAQTALVLGSGLNFFAESLTDKMSMEYTDIPHFLRSTAPGHVGRLVSGMLAGKKVLILQGRFHLYEGHPASAIAQVVRIIRQTGVQNLVLTNAAGGINHSFRPGDLMMLTDHINLTGQNPLCGENDERFGSRFPDMSKAYDPELLRLMRAAGEKTGQRLQQGIYAGVTGPSFETPAEIQMLRTMGADAVGMSTVMETIAAAHCGLRVAGVSCISNMAAGILDQPITLEEVIETGLQVREPFAALLREFVASLPDV